MEKSSSKPNVWFWIISIIAILWFLMGVNAYLQQTYRTEGFTSMLTTEQLDAINAMPAWTTGAFAIAVFAGALGAIALILRKKWSRPLFSLSLLGVLGQMVYYLLMSDSKEVFGPPIMPAIAIVVLLLLIWYTKKITAKGWLS